MYILPYLVWYVCVGLSAGVYLVKTKAKQLIWKWVHWLLEYSVCVYVFECVY